eukprot:1834376-Rhodomonas_salina.1
MAGAAHENVLEGGAGEAVAGPDRERASKRPPNSSSWCTTAPTVSTTAPSPNGPLTPPSGVPRPPQSVRLLLSPNGPLVFFLRYPESVLREYRRPTTSFWCTTVPRVSTVRPPESVQVLVVPRLPESVLRESKRPPGSSACFGTSGKYETQSFRYKRSVPSGVSDMRGQNTKAAHQLQTGSTRRGTRYA